MDSYGNETTYAVCKTDKRRSIYPIEWGMYGEECCGIWCTTITLSNNHCIPNFEFSTDSVHFALIVACRKGVHSTHEEETLYCGITKDWCVYCEDGNFNIPTINNLFKTDYMS